MDFERYRTLRGWSLDDAAQVMRAGTDARLEKITSAMIGRHERGIHFPRPEVIARYAEITENAVTADDWLRLHQSGDIVPPRKRGRRAILDTAAPA
ncbi:helix-turn-helix transcriptional regulator [Novosphingobium sp. NBM11]|uniref:helix-turn-helix transcriptional regulator n=1 Tax=Novosphingobium sp. NBM11 TaxID=2596914 RepID=UPI0018927EEF|nr:helix-turn-helix transcriptional regulator [Novosphingobium sp. NBM11]MBF5091940.1 helix-turn-helix transcriptional regulator [Novosphingobium sp. NBM11]